MRIRTLLSLAIAGAVLTACDDERAITTEPVGELGFGQNLIKTATNLPRGRVIFPTNPTPSTATAFADSLYIDFAGLDSLSTGSYTAWVANDSGTKFARLTGDLTIRSIDTTINNQGDPVFTPSTVTLNNVSQWQNGGQNRTFRFATRRANAAGLAATDSVNTVLISIESGTPGAAPSNRRPLWVRRSESSTTGTPARRFGPLKFGNYAPRVSEQYVFATSVSNTALTANPGQFAATTQIVPRGRIEVRGPIFTVNDSNYYRPPVGYYYEAWAVRIDTLGRAIDTVSLGVKASPYPRRISFYTADTEIPDPESMYGTPTPVIVASQHRVSADSIPAAELDTPFGTRPWTGFAFVYVTLQNKAAPAERMGGSHVMFTGTPTSILGR